MSSLAAAKARFEADKAQARWQAPQNLVPVLGVDFTIANWSNRTLAAYGAQWLPHPRHLDGGWDWPEVLRRYNEPDRLDIVIWSPNERLSGLALGLTTGEAVEIRFLEGDPRPDCPLKGKRALIVLECATCYAQARGRREIRVQPVNEALETLYRDIFGFRLETKGDGTAYYAKSV